MIDNVICLDEKYSTTRLVTQDKLKTVFLLEQENKKKEGGLRTKGYFKKSFENKPLISVVTVVFNGEKFLEETIQSIINQTYDNVEYIIIDGGSNDGTLDIIKKYENEIDYWISEKDNGIYDAMNKGIEVASGEWINFMNGGDGFYEVDSLLKIISADAYRDVDILYGDFEVNYGTFRRLEKAKSLKNIWQGMVFSHQSTFIRAVFHKERKYSLTYNIGGDFEFFYNAYCNAKVFKYIDQVISVMSVEGLSDGNRYKSINQNHKIVNKKSFSLTYNLYYIYLYVDQFLRKIGKKILPSRLVDSIKKHKIS